MIKEFFAIRSYPDIVTDKKIGSNIVLILKLYGIIFILNLFSAPIGYFTDHFVTHVLHLKSIQQHYKTHMSAFFAKYGFWQAFIYVSILGPILEECVFRLPLSFKRKHVAIALSVLLLFFLGLIPGLKNQGSIINIFVRLVLLVCGYFIFNNVLPEHITPGKKRSVVIIIISAISFGLMHIFNFAPLQRQIIYLYPLFVIPQLYIGWALTYLRFKSGFVWCIALHMLNNTVAMLLFAAYKNRL